MHGGHHNALHVRINPVCSGGKKVFDKAPISPEVSMPGLRQVFYGCATGEESMTAKKRRTGSDLKDMALVFAAISIIFAVWLFATIIQVLLDYWHLSLPLLGALLYLWCTREHIPGAPLPSEKTVSTIEEIKTPIGTRHTRTTEKYYPEKSGFDLTWVIRSLF